MSAPKMEPVPDQPPSRRKWRWVIVAACVCLLSWLALGAGLLLDVGTGPMIVLASITAVSTEATMWLAALVLGVSVYQLRRQLWQNLRRRFR